MQVKAPLLCHCEDLTDERLRSATFTIGYGLSSDTRLPVLGVWLLIDNPVTSCLTLIQTLWLNLACWHVFTFSLGGHVALVREFLWVMSRCASLSYLLRHVARVTCPIVMHSASMDLLKTLCVHLCEHRLLFSNFSTTVPFCYQKRTGTL